MDRSKVDPNPSDYIIMGEGRKEWIEKQNMEIRDRLQPPLCVSSLSTLTGLSVGSKVSRTCQMIRMSRSGLSSRRATPSLLLQHGYDWISNEDQRILNAMVMKREAQIEEEDLSLSARHLWEKDRIHLNQLLNEKKRRRNEYLQEKRRIEKEELERRKENIAKSMQYYQAELEERMRERHTRSEQRQKDFAAKKRLNRGDVDADELCHRLRREQFLHDEEIRSNLHINEVEAKELRAEKNLKAIKEHRRRTVKECRYRREKMMEAVQQLREEIEHRFEEWCEESKQRLSNKLCLCQVRASRAIEWKRKMLQEKNQLKRLQHTQAIALLREEDVMRELRARQELFQKDLRMKHVNDKKEQAKIRSRNNAFTTALLRQKIRDAYAHHS